MARKPKPAPIYEKKEGCYRLYACLHGKILKGRRIKNLHAAYTLQAQVNSRVIEYKNGFISSPEGVSLPDFIFNILPSEPEKDNLFNPTIDYLSELIEKYQEDVLIEKEKSTRQTEEGHLKHLKTFLAEKKLGDPLITEINLDFFAQYKKHTNTKVRKVTVNKTLITFQNMFQMAVDNEYLSHNIVRKVKRFIVEDFSEYHFKTTSEIDEILAHDNLTELEIKELRRFRLLSYEEVEKIVSFGKGKWYSTALVAYAFTGMRKGELLKLRWTDVDFNKEIIKVRSKKQSKKKREVVREIPILPKLKIALEEQYAKTKECQWVFTSFSDENKPLSLDTLSSIIQRILKNTKYKGIGYHAFRHFFASHLAAQKVDDRVIDAIMGHNSITSRLRYQHITSEQKADSLCKAFCK